MNSQLWYWVSRGDGEGGKHQVEEKLILKNRYGFASRRLEQIHPNIRANFVFLEYFKIHLVCVKIAFFENIMVFNFIKGQGKLAAV